MACSWMLSRFELDFVYGDYGGYLASVRAVVLFYLDVRVYLSPFLREESDRGNRFVLYIWYYPVRLRVLDSALLDLGRVRMSQWEFSVFCAWVTFGHLFVFLCVPLINMTDIVNSMFSGITTLYLMVPAPGPTTDVPQMWATLLGVMSSILAMVQYTPQLIHTYRLKLVGVLSIPMMCITVPGSALMITGIAFRRVENCV